LPATFLALKAGPGGMNFGMAFAFAIWALTYAMSAAVACVLTAAARGVGRARVAVANAAATTATTKATNAHRSRELLIHPPLSERARGGIRQRFVYGIRGTPARN